ncbi:MAG: hypothetical protein ABI345_04100 [Jatrophihabitans sp.]
MRWDELFGDLEAQADALEIAERAAEVEERTRAEIGTLRMHNRLRAAIGEQIRARFRGDIAVSATIVQVGPDWVLFDEGAGRESLALTAAVLSVRGLGRFSAVPDSESVVAARLTVRHALRGIARDRSATRIHLVDATVIDGTIDRVGADFVEIATHGAGELRRRHDVRDCELLPIAAIAVIRRQV